VSEGRFQALGRTKKATKPHYYGVVSLKARGARPYQARIAPKQGQSFYGGMWSTARDAALAVDRMILHLELERPLNLPRSSKKLGPLSPDELRAMALSVSAHRKAPKLDHAMRVIAGEGSGGSAGLLGQIVPRSVA
jgi:hypothetical protein